MTEVTDLTSGMTEATEVVRMVVTVCGERCDIKVGGDWIVSQLIDWLRGHCALDGDQLIVFVCHTPDVEMSLPPSWRRMADLQPWDDGVVQGSLLADMTPPNHGGVVLGPVDSREPSTGL